MTTQLWAIGLVLLACLVGSFGPILLKKASARSLSSVKSLLTNYYLFFGLALYGVSTVIFIPALKGGELSGLYPLVATSYIWICIFSKFFLDEQLNHYKLLGILLIIIGVGFIGVGS